MQGLNSAISTDGQAQAPQDRPPAFPLRIQPDNAREAGFADLLRLIRASRDALSERLHVHGAILFRGYRADRVAQLAAAVEAISSGARLLEYKGGASPRSAIPSGGRPVYNSTEYPPDMELSLHNELSYSDVYPSRIFFLCLTAPAQGGETTLGDSRRVLQRMPAGVRRRFEEKGICYVRTLPPGRGSGYSWQDAFDTDDRAEVARQCAAMGARCEWRGGDLLRVRQVRPAIVVHPITGERVWFNQADGFHPSALDPATHARLLAQCGTEELFRLNVRYGDGTPIAIADLEAVRQVIRQETRAHAWQPGDILMLDNLLAAHGRRPFRGPRRIAVAMN